MDSKITGQKLPQVVNTQQDNEEKITRYNPPIETSYIS